MPKAARYRTFDIVPSDPVRWSWIEVDGKVVTTQNMEGPSIAPQNPAHDSSLEDNEPGDSMDIDYTEESDEDGDDMSIASCAVEEEEPRPEVLDDAEAGPHAEFINSEGQAEQSGKETQLREHLLAPLFRLETTSRKSLKKCSTCSEKGCTLYRCRDCLGGRMRCRQCIVSCHMEIPFHQVEQWTGKYFKRISMAMLGLKLYCGHHGTPCPSVSSECSAVLTVIDSGGIHRLPVYECRCARGKKRTFATQLILMGLFPATDNAPETAATFQALEDFDMHNLSGKVSIWDYYESLRRKSNSVQPHLVPDVYYNFRRMTRQYRALKAIKRTGHCRTKDLGPGDLVVQCPSCPRPGVNMPDDWKSEQWRRLIYTRTLSVDGNFVLSRKSKGGGATKDPSLLGDYGFWAVQKTLDNYMTNLKEAGKLIDYTPKENTCSNFKAGSPSKGPAEGEVPGVSAASCTRHSFIQPNSVVDFRKGEGYAFIDVSFAAPMKSADIEQRQLHTYDVMCKFSVNRESRLIAGGLFDPKEIPQDRAEKVPVWHLGAHVAACGDRHNLRFTELVGRTCGEGVESIWAFLNGFGNATREMGFGHRRDSLSAALNSHNWWKLVLEAGRIKKDYLKACVQYEIHNAMYDNIKNGIPRSDREKLEKDSACRNGDQYRPTPQNEPSRVKILSSLVEEEERSRQTERLSWPNHAGSKTPAAMFLSNAMDLEELRDEFIDATRNKSGEVSQKELLVLRNRLERANKVHFDTYAELVPGILDLPRIQVAPAGRQDLYLPHSLSPEEKEHLGVHQLAELEVKLRIGQCYDWASKLRDALGLKGMLASSKYSQPTGNRTKTRSITQSARTNVLIQRAARLYRLSWDAATSGKDAKEVESIMGPLKALGNSDLRTLQSYVEDGRFNPKNLPVSWIWRMSPSLNLASGDVEQAVKLWTEEVVRLEWLHARAARDRWWEEKELLLSELDRVGRTFRHEERRWEAVAVTGHWGAYKPRKLAREGMRAYAAKRAAMFQTLAVDAEEKRHEVTAVYPPFDPSR